LVAELVTVRAARRNGAPRRKLRFCFATRRLREIEWIITLRHTVVPPIDDADIYLNPVAQCLRCILAKNGKRAEFDDVLDRLIVWAERRFAPDVVTDAPELLDQAARVALRDPRLEDGQTLGDALRLSYEDRAYLRITTIGSFDVDKAGRTKRRNARRRQRDKERQARKRAERGAAPHAQSARRLKPWIAEGISRRTWYRRRYPSAGSTNSSPPTLSTAGRRIGVTTDDDGEKARKREFEGKVSLGHVVSLLHGVTGEKISVVGLVL
jgi:hypothetical protein